VESFVEQIREKSLAALPTMQSGTNQGQAIFEIVNASLIEILGQHQIPTSEVHFDRETMKFKAITRNSGAIIPILLKISVI
jgi:signal recognition particle GTPase